MRTEMITALFVVAMFTTSAFMIYGGHSGTPTLSVTMSNGTATVDYSMPASTFPYPSVLVALTMDSYQADSIAILMTGKGGTPNSDPANVQGLMDHLGAELANIGSSLSVRSIDESSLTAYLASGPGILVIACQINVSTGQAVENWVREGGFLVAIGPGCVPFIGSGGALDIGFGRYAYDGTTVEGSFAQDLGLRTIYPSNGPIVADVLSNNGTVLGHTTTDGILTTTATVPLGSGRVMVMGGPIESPFLASMEDVYAWDLARLIESGAPWVVGPIIHDNFLVPKKGLEGSLSFDMGTMPVRVSIFSLDDSHALFRGVTVTP